MTIKPAIERRLSVPCTPTELAALLGLPVRTVRCHLYQMRSQNRVERLERTIKTTRRPEHLWQRKYLQELV